MPLNKLLLLLVFFISSYAYTQDMQEGFSYLEAGDYVKAEPFFANDDTTIPVFR